MLSVLESLTPLAGLVNRALIEVPRLLLVLGDGLDVHDGHAGVELLQVALCNITRSHIPASPLGTINVAVLSPP